MNLKGWFLSGSHPFNYEMGVDREVLYKKKFSGYLKSKTVHGAGQFGILMQQFNAKNYRGKRMRLSCFMATKGVQQSARLWMQITDGFEDIIKFDDMRDRLIMGTESWKNYSVVLDVPENSKMIFFGIMLCGTGQLWINQLAFEEVDKSVETTNLYSPPQVLDEPINLSFEENTKE